MDATYKRCKLCKKKLVGRRDKIFCDTKCKNDYHYFLEKANLAVTTPIDKILHRNREILLEIMGKSGTKKKIPKLTLDKKKFNYSYITGIHTNKYGKTVYNIYDFSYIPFSDQYILVTRNIKFSPTLS